MKSLFTLLVCFQLSAKGTGSGLTIHSTAITLTVTITNPTCQKSNGKVIVQASGGIAPYTYIFNGPHAGGQPDGYFVKVPAGTFVVTVVDANNQSATQNVTLTNTFTAPTPIVVGKQKPSGCNSFDGSLTLGGTGGLAPYTYSIDNINYYSSNVFNNLTAGDYMYAVKDANGCSSFPSMLSHIANIQQNCNFYCNGSAGAISCDPYILDIRLDNIVGGSPPYTYSKDGINYQSSNDFNYLAPGLNTFWIKDASGLITLYSVSTMDECDPVFSINTLIQSAHCGQNGSIVVTANDGTAPYTYSIDGITFQASNQFVGLIPGNYTITVKDFNGLHASKLAVVTNNCIIVTPTITNSTCGNSNGKINVLATNGLNPYQYSLDGINYTASNVFTNLAASNYTVYVKDATGIISTTNAIVNNVAGPVINSINTTQTGCDNHSGVINVSVGGGTAPFTYSLDGNTFQNTSVFNSLSQNNYTITVKDANGCIVTKPAIITMSNTPPVVNLGKDLTLCEDNTVILDATNLNSSYLWQDNSTSSTFLVTKAGQYFVTVNKQGCIAKDTINIDYNLKPRFSLGNDSRICLGSLIILDPKITGVTYLWQDGSTNQTYTVKQPGLYSLTATNICGSTIHEITFGKGICDLYIPNSFTPNGDTKNDFFRASYGDNVTEFHLQIFNRYGQIIFETKDKNNGWDGTFKGTKQPFDGYVWIIEYKTEINKSLQKLQGTVLLMR